MSVKNIEQNSLPLKATCFRKLSAVTAISLPGGAPILGNTGDVQPEWVSFLGQKSVDGCKFLPKNLRIGHGFNT